MEHGPLRVHTARRHNGGERDARPLDQEGFCGVDFAAENELSGRKKYGVAWLSRGKRGLHRRGIVGSVVGRGPIGSHISDHSLPNVRIRAIQMEAQRAEFILQERIDFLPTIETPEGATKAEVRVMYVWPEGAKEPVATTTIIRMGRGKMMGVDHNKNMEWVGASAAFLV